MNLRLICLSSAQASGTLDADVDAIWIENENTQQGETCRRIAESTFNNHQDVLGFDEINFYAHVVGVKDADDFEAGCTALAYALRSLSNDEEEGLGGSDGRGVYVREITTEVEAAATAEDDFLIDIFSQHLLDAWKMSTKERLLCEKFDGAAFAALAALSTSDDLAEHMDYQARQRLIEMALDAHHIDAKSLLGKRDGRSSDTAFFNLVNAQLRKYAGKRPETEVKLKLVKLIHEAQERGGLLHFDGVACRVTCRKRADASTYSFSLRPLGGGREIKSVSAVPSNLEIIPNRERKSLDRPLASGLNNPKPSR